MENTLENSVLSIISSNFRYQSYDQLYAKIVIDFVSKSNGSFNLDRDKKDLMDQTKKIVNQMFKNNELEIDTKGNYFLTRNVSSYNSKGQPIKHGRFDKKKEIRAEKNLVGPEIEGILHLTKKGTGFVDPDDNPKTQNSMFVPVSFLNGALEGDVVKIRKLPPKDGAYGDVYSVVSVTERTNTRLACQFKSFANCFRCTNDAIDMNFYVTNFSDFADRINDEDIVVIDKIDYSNPERPKGIITRVLGKENLGTLLEGLLINFKIPVEFSEELLEKASKAHEPNEEDQKGRKDFTNIPFVTIDPETAKDFDDAICVERLPVGGYKSYVAIADVPVDPEEVADRGTSIYPPGTVIPMTPPEFSENICSLKEGVTRLTTVVEAEYDRNGKLLKSEISRGYILSQGRFDYGTVNKLFNGENIDDERYLKAKDMLFAFKEFTEKLQEIDKKNGKLDFDNDETKFTMDKDLSATEAEKEERGAAEKGIESMMIEANCTVAEYLLKNNLPGIYRVHGEPNPERLQNVVLILEQMGFPIKELPEEFGNQFLETINEWTPDKTTRQALNCLCLQTMDKATYQAYCNGHYGLKREHYCHYTSPIRRISDLYVRKILTLALTTRLDDEKKASLNDEAKEYAKIATMTERRADKVCKAAGKICAAELLSKCIGGTLEGTVTDVTKDGLYVGFENGTEGFLPLSKFPQRVPINTADGKELKVWHIGKEQKITIGSKLNVVVDESNIRKGEVKLGYVSVIQSKPIFEKEDSEKKTKNMTFSPKSPKLTKDDNCDIMEAT